MAKGGKGARGGGPPPRPVAPAPGRTARWPAFVALACVAGAVYLNALGGGLFFDDRPAIVENVYVLERGPIAIFTEPSWWGTHTQITTWRPLTTLSFWMNHALHGLAPLGYHAVNVGLHAAVTALLLAVFARVTSFPTALIAAALFAVHPVHTEAVASVVGRAELWSALGFFAAWWCFLAADAARAATPTRTAAGLEAAGVLAFFLAMLGKENAVTLLPVLVFADWLQSPPAAVGTTLRRRLPRYAALTLAALLFIWIRVRVSGETTPAIPPLDNPLVTLAGAERWMTAIAVVAYYAWRLVCPLWLSADYTAWQIPPATTPLDPRFLAGLAILLAVPATIWLWRRRDPALALGLGLMAITFAIVSNLPFLIATIMAERWLYLPSAGFCLAAGTLLGRLIAPDGTGDWVRWSTWRRAALPLGALLALLALRTWTRNAVWHDPAIFFTTMVENAPRSSSAHSGYADVLAEAGRYPEAIAEYQQALAIAPTSWRADYNLGNALLASGDIAGAIAAYERTLAAQPDYAKPMINLGAAESRRGNHAAAAAWLRRALALEPQVPRIHASLANVLAAAGDRDGARAEFEAALALAPNSADVLADYGAFATAGGAHADAITLLRRSVALQPNVAERHYNLGNALAQTGNYAAAVASYQQALALRPAFTQAMENLGNTESLRGNHAAALEWFRRAQAKGAVSVQLHANIANELARLQRWSEARAEYQAAFALAPDAPGLRANYEAFLAMEAGAAR